MRSVCLGISKEGSPDMNLQISINKIKELDAVLDISRKVFEPSMEEIRRYHDRNDWLEKINNGGLLITVSDNMTPVGFAICYSKENYLHIWNVGVLEDYRKLGIWNEMYEHIIHFAELNKFKHLSLNTYKEKFPHMYSFCIKNGFREVKTEDGKSFFMKDI